VQENKRERKGERERERERENRAQSRPTPSQYMRFLSEKSAIFVRALLQKRRDICRGDMWRIQRALHKCARSLTTIDKEPYTNMHRAQLKYAKGPTQICEEPYTNLQRALLKHAQSPTSIANEQYSRSRANKPQSKEPYTTRAHFQVCYASIPAVRCSALQCVAVTVGWRRWAGFFKYHVFLAKVPTQK